MLPEITIPNDRKIRLAIVGCGRISKNHFGSIEKHNDQVELVAICDINKKVLDEHASKYEVNAYLYMHEMLEKEDLDLIVLCTPSGIHAQQTVLAEKHKVNVMTEKPMATRWQDGQSMVKACDEAGVYLFVVKQNRRNTTLQLLKQAVDGKRFGRIHMVHLNVFGRARRNIMTRPNGGVHGSSMVGRS